MAIALLEAIDGNEAYFEDNETIGADNGRITWSTPEEVSAGRWEFDYSGTDTDGCTISNTTESMDSVELPTPSQVFWFLADKAKEILCPTCSEGY